MISRLIRKLQHRLSCIAGWTENMEEKKYKAIIEGILFSMGESVELEGPQVLVGSPGRVLDLIRRKQRN